MLTANGAFSADPVCVPANGTHLNTSGLKRYRMNSASFDVLTGLTRNQVASAVSIGASRWNEQANSGYFKALLSTSDIDIPVTSAGCKAAGIDYSIVVASATDYGAKAVQQPRCGGEQFRILIRANDQYGQPWNWATGDVPSNR